MENLTRQNVITRAMSGGELQGEDLSGLDLRDSIISYLTLPHGYVNLRGSNLSFVKLNNSFLDGANLQGCDLRYANISRADLNSADLRGATYDQEQLKDSKNVDKTIL